MTYVILGLIFVELFLQIQASSAVVGSRQRYVALSLRRITSWLVNLAFIGEGFFALAIGQQADALWYIILGAIGVVLELRTHKNDDDWFNGRGAKIKHGIRRMLTAPRPRAAPAFGMIHPRASSEGSPNVPLRAVAWPQRAGTRWFAVLFTQKGFTAADRRDF
jgi:hypothetical protein